MEAEKSYGKTVARKYVQRIDIMKQVKNINELCQLPALKCHPLKQDRKGQWAVRLTDYYRLIFTLEGDKLEIARIEEVSRHYEN